jgi:hypothetical protein
MGILARLVGFIWRRWADYQSVVALLDVLDFKTAIGGGLGFVIMTFIGATNMDWSAPAVVLAALAAGALVSIILVAVRVLWRTMPAKTAEEANTNVADNRSASSLMEDYQAGKWAPSYPPLRGAAPDWPIRELFGHIRPDYPLTSSKTVGVATTDDLDDRWKPIGDEVIKQLSVGNLHATGRKEAHRPFRHLAPALIPQSYWQSAKFSFFFLDHDAQNQEHVVNDDGERYSDLEVSRAEALTIWPLEPWPNFKKWDKKEKFELYEAACLWFNLEPSITVARLI